MGSGEREARRETREKGRRRKGEKGKEEKEMEVCTTHCQFLKFLS
jgi:hypothetical protein